MAETPPKPGNSTRTYTRARRDVGTLGEDLFKAWSGRGYTLIPSQPDRMGWDFFVEFEPDDIPDVPHDMRPGMKKAFVQVKSTDAQQSSVVAKLSALKRLVDADLPAFILHMEFDRDQQPTRVRLLHIDRTEIESVQRAVRKAQHAGRVDFNNIDHRLSLASAKKLSLDGSDAGDAIYSVITENPHEYGVAKASFRKSCGFNDKSFMGGFKLADGLTERDLAYLLVGRTPTLAVSRVVIQGSRFGISLPGERLELEEGELSVEAKPFQTGKVTAIAIGGIRRATLPVNVYGSGGADLSPENQLLRLTHDVIDWIINVNTHEDEFKLRIEYDKKFPLAELARVMNFALILQDEGTSIAVEFGNQQSARFTPLDRIRLPPGWRTLTEFCSFLASACSREWSDQLVEMSLRELAKALNDNEQMYAAATRPGANFVFRSEDAITVPPGTEGYVFLPICIDFADLVYTAVAKADAPPRAAAKDRVSFTGAKPEIIEEAIAPRHDGLHDQLNARIDQLAQGTFQPGTWIVTARVGRSEVGTPARKPTRQVNPSRRPALPLPKRGRRKQK